jgi:DNA polymerase
MGDPREELRYMAASLRAYVEWQLDTGALGIPKAARSHPVARSALVESELAPPAASFVAPVLTAPPALRAVEVLAPQAPVDRAVRLPLLAKEVAGCTKCGLSMTRTKVVVFRGNPEASICFVGEAPGEEEDATGFPFVGRAGQLLDRMITAMGLVPQRDVYICNIVKCRPPNNRGPTDQEMATCMPYLHEQLALVAPKVIVALGNTAVAGLLGSKVGITRLRGSWKLYRTTPVMPTYHPSYLLRPSGQQAEARRQVWEDLQAVMSQLGLPPRPQRKPG